MSGGLKKKGEIPKKKDAHLPAAQKIALFEIVDSYPRLKNAKYDVSFHLQRL